MYSDRGNENSRKVLKNIKRLKLNRLISVIIFLLAFIPGTVHGSNTMKEDPNSYSVIYFKNNQFYMFEKSGENQKLSDTVFLGVNNDEDVYRQYQNDFAQASKDGNTVYFIESYDLDRRVGELYIKESRKEKEKIASEVSKYFTISEDGSTVLFLKNYDFENDTGELYAYSKGQKIEKIADEVSRDRYFITSEGNKFIFLENHKHTYAKSELYIKEKSKEKVKIDSDVYHVSSISDDGNIITYQKLTDIKNPYIYTLFVKEKDKEPQKIADDVFINIYNKDGTQIAYLANYQVDKGYGDLYFKTFGKKSAEEMVDNKVSYIMENDRPMNDLTVFYYKLNENKLKLNDIYIKRIGREKEKLITPNEAELEYDLQCDLDGNLIAYTVYDTNNRYKSLYVHRFKNGKWKEREKISDNVFDFAVSNKGGRIAYLRNRVDYEVDLYLYTEEGKSEKISDDVDYDYLINNEGNAIIFLARGNDYKWDLWKFEAGKGKYKVDSDVFRFYTYDFNGIVYLKDYSLEWKGNLYIHKGQDEPEKIDEDVFSILTVH
ncbi:hypothetical protein [Defluviitalea raffinosedens]|uniref:hypothetical protein n=1 Tax=Defluviitalea raffinosedens TaxID=1450156 RepID=UPI00195A319E|nr:hypothetical protein [Defluviitalea raffinosedens]MBM7685870.1 hypothetical protein [Defluviitalea raffinosedens]